MKPRYIVHTIFSILMAAGLSSLYLFLPNVYQTLDNRLRDFMFLYRGEIPTTGQVAVIDIDEKSLKDIGQWPWERTIMAQVLQNATAMGAGIIGFDIVFAEEDRTSPDAFAKRMGLDPTQFPNNDELFAQTIAQTPTIMGYVMDIDDEGKQGFDPPQIPAIFVERGLVGDSFVVESNGVITNIPVLQDNSYSSGFFNNIPDESGMIRSVPMVMRYDGQIYPSLSFEMLRIITESNRVNIYYGDNGVDGVELNNIYVPTDRYGRLFVNFRGKAKTFDYISAVDIYNGTVDPERLAGKLLLVGTSAAGLLDLRAVPFDNIFPGVEVHANVLDNVLAGDFLARPSWAEAADVILILTIVAIGGLLFTFLSAEWMLVVTVAGVYGLFQLLYYLLFTEGMILNILFPITTLVATAVMSVLINYFFETRLKNMIKGKFASKVSPQVMEDIIKNSESGNDAFIAKEHEISVTFSDVRNFTNISEAAGSAQVLIQFLNEYMDEMTKIIMKYEGTVDKFIGDAIMAYWNAPAVVEDHVEKAVDATLDQIHAVTPLNAIVKKDERFKPICDMAAKSGVEPIEIGIGINVGVATIGEMGSSGRSDYTAIGDPINLGARLESLCKYYNSMCNISNHVKERIPNDKYIFRFLDLVTVKGQSVPVEIWQIHDYAQLPSEWKNDHLYKIPKEKLFAELEEYHGAIDLYKNSKFEEALKIFKEMDANEEKSNKNIYKIYIERCEHYIEEPPVDFNGVFVHKTKG